MGTVTVTIGGLLRGRELAGDAQLALDGGALRLTRPTGTALLTIPLAALEGLRFDERTITLFLEGEDAIELSGDDRPALRTLAREIVARGCALPELTRALRSLGSHRSSGLAEHDRFFSPLLSSRRNAEAARDPIVQVAAFDVPVLRARLEELVRRAAAEHYPEHPAARRSLEAELQECVEPLEERLKALLEMGLRVREEPEETRLVAWRAWATALADVFVCADACWSSVASVLRLEPYEQPRPWWRRMMRRGADAR